MRFRVKDDIGKAIPILTVPANATEAEKRSLLRLRLITPSEIPILSSFRCKYDWSGEFAICSTPGSRRYYLLETGKVIGESTDSTYHTVCDLFPIALVFNMGYIDIIARLAMIEED